MKQLSVIVYGPQACGKTRNAETLRVGLGLSRIMDDWDGSEPIPRYGALVLTNNPEAMNSVRNSERYTYDAAMRLAGVA